MEIKILNKDSIPEDKYKLLLEYMDETTSQFAKEAYIFLNELYSFKKCFTYKPTSLIQSICAYIISCCIICELAVIVSHYINIMLYNYSIINIIYSFILFILQFCLLMFVLYTDMLYSKDYRKKCHEKLINSEINQKYILGLLDKADELGIELEIIKNNDEK